MAWGPPVQGAPRDAKKIWTAHGSGQGFFLGWQAKKKKKGSSPPVLRLHPRPEILENTLVRATAILWHGAPQCLNPALDRQVLRIDKNNHIGLIYQMTKLLAPNGDVYRQFPLPSCFYSMKRR
jgi:hypothetical protein